MGRVCSLTPDLRYYLCMYPVDMRKQFNGLQGIVTQEFGRYVTSDEAFVFVGKRRTTLKILHREGNGMTLYVRKLTSVGFKMPHLEDDNRTCILTSQEFNLLILGEDWIRKTGKNQDENVK